MKHFDVCIQDYGNKYMHAYIYMTHGIEAFRLTVINLFKLIFEVEIIIKPIG